MAPTEAGFALRNSSAKPDKRGPQRQPGTTRLQQTWQVICKVHATGCALQVRHRHMWYVSAYVEPRIHSRNPPRSSQKPGVSACSAV